jgi:hypothetical protein
MFGQGPEFEPQSGHLLLHFFPDHFIFHVALDVHAHLPFFLSTARFSFVVEFLLSEAKLPHHLGASPWGLGNEAEATLRTQQCALVRGDIFDNRARPWLCPPLYVCFLILSLHFHSHIQ